MNTTTVKKLFNFATQVEKLKKMERYKGQYYWKDYPKLERYESVADHTWRVGILVLMFANQLSQHLDTLKALKIALIHDLPEIMAGDDSPMGQDGTGKKTYAFNKKIASLRHSQEKNAATALFNRLPSDISRDFFNLWLEYEQGKSFEAKVVKSLDKIEAMMQVLEYRQGHMFKEHLEFTINYGLRGSDIDPAIARFGKHIANELRKKYKQFNLCAKN